MNTPAKHAQDSTNAQPKVTKNTTNLIIFLIFLIIFLDCLEETSGTFWDESSKSCLFCEFPCLTCTGSSTNCLQCKHEPHLRTSFPDCDCIDGYYPLILNRLPRCLKCPLPCKTCSSESVCTSLDCNNEVTGTYSVPQSDGELKCEKCPYPCSTCNDAGECLSN